MKLPCDILLSLLRLATQSSSTRWNWSRILFRMHKSLTLGTPILYAPVTGAHVIANVIYWKLDRLNFNIFFSIFSTLERRILKYCVHVRPLCTIWDIVKFEEAHKAVTKKVPGLPYHVRIKTVIFFPITKVYARPINRKIDSGWRLYSSWTLIVLHIFPTIKPRIKTLVR